MQGNRGVIEGNLDSVIQTPRRHRSELAQFIHHPIFRHVLYSPFDEADSPFSTNVAALWAIVDRLDIENDPCVRKLHHQLSQAQPGTTEYNGVDQKLSKVIHKQNSFMHKGLHDFARTASEIWHDLGALVRMAGY